MGRIEESPSGKQIPGEGEEEILGEGEEILGEEEEEIPGGNAT